MCVGGVVMCVCVGGSCSYVCVGGVVMCVCV